jgi:glycyl-tRNA synthetase beta chain
VTTLKGEYISATVHRAGKSAGEILAQTVPAEIAGIYWAKSMYWRPGKPERFVRPLRWLVAMLDREIVPVAFAGVTASSKTFGHRILHGDKPISIAVAADYVATLEKAGVICEPSVREHRIRKALDAATRTVPNARWREDASLLDTVVNLTESPAVIIGSFDTHFLELPDEVLVTVMRDHQKYFAVEDASGKLAPHFLAVLNTQPSDAAADLIRHGNERVLQARFNDAKFFWETDQKVSLENRVESLKSVTFHKHLGSYFEKTEANLRIARELAKLVPDANADALAIAARLAKADLTTELVKEFTELQGTIGGLYARAQGLPDEVAQAIYDQYRPQFVGDAVPKTATGALLSLADRANTIVDMFAIGLAPTGSRDPFALRRAANGVVQILASHAMPVSISQLVGIAVTQSALGERAAKVQPQVIAFLRERLQFYIQETLSYSYDLVNAVLAPAADDVRDVLARAQATAAVRPTPDFEAISTAFRRTKNILRQAAEKSDAPSSAVDAKLLTEPAEQALHAQILNVSPRVEAHRRKAEYPQALELIASLRPQVDAFFDSVMVMAPDAKLRANRLALLQELYEEFSRIADFSEFAAPSSAKP